MPKFDRSQFMREIAEVKDQEPVKTVAFSSLNRKEYKRGPQSEKLITLKPCGDVLRKRLKNGLVQERMFCPFCAERAGFIEY